MDYVLCCWTSPLFLKSIYCHHAAAKDQSDVVISVFWNEFKVLNTTVLITISKLLLFFLFESMPFKVLVFIFLLLVYYTAIIMSRRKNWATWSLLMSVRPGKVPAGVGNLHPSVHLLSVMMQRSLGQGRRRKIPSSFSLWVFWRHNNRSIYYCCSFLMALLKASNSSNVWWAPSPAMSNELSVTNSDVNSACTGQFAINLNSLAFLLTVIFISLVDWAKGSAPKIPKSKAFKVSVQTVQFRAISSPPLA